MDNLEEQQNQKGTKGTTILKDMWPKRLENKGQNTKQKMKKAKEPWKVFEFFWTLSTKNMSLEQKNAIGNNNTQTWAWNNNNTTVKSNIWTQAWTNKNTNLEQ